MDVHGMLKHLQWVEEEIIDIQQLLRGSQTSKHWQDWKMKLDNLQGERRQMIWVRDRDELREKVKVSPDGTHVIDFQGAIPDL